MKKAIVQLGAGAVFGSVLLMIGFVMGFATCRFGAFQGFPLLEVRNPISTQAKTLGAGANVDLHLANVTDETGIDPESPTIDDESTLKPEFEEQTKESMLDRNATVAVVCLAPKEILDQFEIIDRDVEKFVAFRLHENKIVVAPPDRVTAWLETNKNSSKPEEVGAAFKVTYVICIDLEEFSLYEVGHPNLYRGRSKSMISVWKMNADGETAEKIFVTENAREFPTDQSVSTSEETYLEFKGRYLSTLSHQIGVFFYGYQ